MSNTSDNIACTLVATFITTITIGGIFYAIVFFGEPTQSGFIDYMAAIALWTFMTVIIATFIAIIYGIPAYHLMVKLGFANYLSMPLVGAIPGMLFFSYDQTPLSAISILFGVVIAVLSFWFKSKVHFS